MSRGEEPHVLERLSGPQPVGAPVVLKDYVRFQLGEGIEKKVSDFAAEVAEAAGLQPA